MEQERGSTGPPAVPSKPIVAFRESVRSKSTSDWNERARKVLQRSISIGNLPENTSSALKLRFQDEELEEEFWEHCAATTIIPIRIGFALAILGNIPFFFDEIFDKTLEMKLVRAAVCVALSFCFSATFFVPHWKRHSRWWIGWFLFVNFAAKIVDGWMADRVLEMRYSMMLILYGSHGFARVGYRFITLLGLIGCTVFTTTLTVAPRATLFKVFNIAMPIWIVQLAGMVSSYNIEVADRLQTLMAHNLRIRLHLNEPEPEPLQVVRVTAEDQENLGGASSAATGKLWSSSTETKTIHGIPVPQGWTLDRVRWRFVNKMMEHSFQLFRARRARVWLFWHYVTLLVAAVLYGLQDTYLFPGSAQTLVLLRYGGMVPALLLAILLLPTRLFSQHMEVFVTVVVFLYGGFSLSFLLSLPHTDDGFVNEIYAAYVYRVILLAHATFRMGGLPATVCSVAITVTMAAAASEVVVFSTILMFIVTVLIGVCLTIVIEVKHRVYFALKTLQKVLDEQPQKFSMDDFVSGSSDLMSTLSESVLDW